MAVTEVSVCAECGHRLAPVLIREGSRFHVLCGPDGARFLADPLLRPLTKAPVPGVGGEASPGTGHHPPVNQHPTTPTATETATNSNPTSTSPATLGPPRNR